MSLLEIFQLDAFLTSKATMKNNFKKTLKPKKEVHQYSGHIRELNEGLALLGKGKPKKWEEEFDSQFSVIELISDFKKQEEWQVERYEKQIEFIKKVIQQERQEERESTRSIVKEMIAKEGAILPEPYELALKDLLEKLK